MDTFELFNNGKLVLPEKEAGFAEIEWSKHPTFKGVELNKRIVWPPYYGPTAICGGLPLLRNGLSGT